MIAYIQGKIIDLEQNSILILTQSGVWYEVFINESTFSKLAWESEASLYIYHHITEWAQSLFGCMSLEEKSVFTELIKISWVWGKVALNILNLWWEKLSQAVMLEDQKTIESIKWIGKKMAEKIILELKDKDFVKHAGTQVSSHTSQSQVTPLVQSQILDTLTAMWYSREAIGKAMQSLPEWMNDMDDILPFVIKNI